MEEVPMDDIVVDEMVSNYTFDFDICDIETLITSSSKLMSLV